MIFIGKIILHFLTGGAANALINAWTKHGEEKESESEALIGADAAQARIAVAEANNPHLLIAGAHAFVVWMAGVAFTVGVTATIIVEVWQWFVSGGVDAFIIDPQQAWMIAAVLGFGGLNTVARAWKG